MKTPTIAILILMTAACYGQELTGQWNGALNIQGSSYRIVFHITKADKQYKATLDSPDQKASDIPVTTLSFNPPTVKFEISTIGLIYEGTLSENLITGEWRQAGLTFPLVLSKGESRIKETK